MEFLKNLFTNDNSIIGLCGFEEKNDLTDEAEENGFKTSSDIKIDIDF